MSKVGSFHVDCCRVHCGGVDSYERFDRKHRWGCDLVIFSSRIIYLIEAKSGHVTWSDAGKAIEQLRRTERYMRNKGGSRRYKLVKVFVYNERLDERAVERLSGEGIYIVHSEYDVAKKLKSFIV